MLSAEGNEIGHRRLVAALDVGPEKLAALREADAVDGGGGGEDGVRGEVGAYLVDLEGEVADECRGAIGGGVGV